MRPFEYGDKVVLIDNKLRRYLVTLEQGAEFHSHSGYLRHVTIVGQPEGTLFLTTRQAKYWAMRPSLEDFVLQMPRGAQVIYPKDLAPICMMADIGPGVRVFETGLGSGALSMTMLRYGAQILGYEIREDFLHRARTNVEEFLGPDALQRYDTHLRDAYEGIDAEGLDRVVLDLPEPWRVVPHAEVAMRPGGILLAYTPSITQAMQTRESLDRGPWIEQRTLEVLHRTWHVEGQAVRPDHRMVAHTAFLTIARLLGGGGPARAEEGRPTADPSQDADTPLSEPVTGRPEARP